VSALQDTVTCTAVDAHSNQSQQTFVVTVVFSDNAFGNVLRMQKELYGGRVIATSLHNPDFARIADDFGAVGMHARDAQELRDELPKAFALKRPVLIEVPVTEMPDPRRFTNLPRVRGKV